MITHWAPPTETPFNLINSINNNRFCNFFSGNQHMSVGHSVHAFQNRMFTSISANQQRNKNKQVLHSSAQTSNSMLNTFNCTQPSTNRMGIAEEEQLRARFQNLHIGSDRNNTSLLSQTVVDDQSKHAPQLLDVSGKNSFLLSNYSVFHNTLCIT